MVDAATTAITITDPPTIESTNPTPHRRRQNHYDYDKSVRRRSRGSVDAELLLLGEPKCYGSGRAEELPERGAAGVRVRALGHYSRGSGNVAAGGERKRYETGRAEALRKGSSGSLSGEAGGRREGVSAGPLLSAERRG